MTGTNQPNVDFDIEDELANIKDFIQDFHSEYMLNINELKHSVSTENHNFLCALYILTVRPDLWAKLANETPF